MGSGSRPSSPTLPGGWRSTWTFSANHCEESAARLSFGKATPQNEIHHPALLESPAFFECDVASHGGSIVRDDDVSSCGSFDGESTQSDDFYSISSHQNGDTILSPEMISMSPNKGEGNSHDILNYAIPDPRNCPARSSSRLSLHSLEGVTLADDASSKVSVGSCSAHSPARKTHLALDMDNISSKSSLVSRLSRRSSATSSSSRSMVLRQTEPRRNSTHSDYSGLNYAGVCNLIDQLDVGNMSEESFPRPQTPSRFNTPRQIHRRRIDHANRPAGDTLELSQPSADDPWTLSLDPALSSTSESTSLSSASSSSLNASQAEDRSERHPPSAITFPQPDSLPSQPSITCAENESHELDASTTRLGSNDSIYARPIDQPFPVGSNSLPFPPCPQEGHPRQTKNVLKKTKDLYSKFKSFIISKKSKQSDPKPMISDPSASSDFCRMDLQPPMEYHRSPSSSTTSWSYQQRGVGIFQRSAKMSTPSVAFSSRTEIASTSRTPSVNKKYPYEYHARPKTMEELRRSKRRFSLPTFTGPASGSNTSAAKNPHTSSQPHRRQREGSILSAR
ncbi:hypothetical protein GALMADRAFT_313409 [Galerina marginata CBS 339.88]|uniref:Uncharacterized protein n=1 Tax=Galerina marginata (strain CBS 339.88) TaxID=685588 RepID=A0A067TYI7_GALM3|nr:hypothetical protein GALMADRAFT_313409 [Galerina marginata CBS 339.88]